MEKECDSHFDEVSMTSHHEYNQDEFDLLTFLSMMKMQICIKDFICDAIDK